LVERPPMVLKEFSVSYVLKTLLIFLFPFCRFSPIPNPLYFKAPVKFVSIMGHQTCECDTDCFRTVKLTEKSGLKC
jgi:hypothetical protein